MQGSNGDAGGSAKYFVTGFAIADFDAADLREATQRLYDVFGRYTVTFPLAACDCCVFDDHQTQLSCRPLAELSADDLSYYAFKAITTFGTADDFRHFMPRLFELIVGPGFFPINVEIVFGKLNEAVWRTWPVEEQEAVEHFLKAMWREQLLADEPGMFLDDCVGCLGRVVETMTPFLAYWTAGMEREAAARMKTAAYFCEDRPFDDDGLPAFLEEHPERWREVMDWLRAESTAAVMRQALAEWHATPEGASYDFVAEQYETWLAAEA